MIVICESYHREHVLIGKLNASRKFAGGITQLTLNCTLSRGISTPQRALIPPSYWNTPVDGVA